MVSYISRELEGGQTYIVIPRALIGAKNSVSHLIGSSGVMVGLCPPVGARGGHRSVVILSELGVILMSRTLLILAMGVTMMVGHQLHVNQVRILLRMTGVILPGAVGRTRVLETSS